MPVEKFYPSRKSRIDGDRFEVSWGDEGINPVELTMWTWLESGDRRATNVDLDHSALVRLEKVIRRAKRFSQERV